MATEIWFLDQARNRRGPVGPEAIAGLIRDGTIRRDTLVWTAGMADWRAAAEAPAVSFHFAPPSPPRPQPGTTQGVMPGVTPAPASLWSAPSPGAANFGTAAAALPGLRSALPVWGLFGWMLLLGIGNVLIIPSPWTSTGYFRFLVRHLALPDGRKLTFAGQAGDIWFVFIALALLPMIGLIPFAGLLTFLLTAALNVRVLKWLCARTDTAEGGLRLSFGGGYWANIGWYVLLLLSCITIIGWAWVVVAWMRWVCRNVHGTIGFGFAGSGPAVLGRTLLLWLLCILIIPIPWALRWYANWFLSQVTVGSPAAAA